MYTTKERIYINIHAHMCTMKQAEENIIEQTLKNFTPQNLHCNSHTRQNLRGKVIHLIWCDDIIMQQIIITTLH